MTIGDNAIIGADTTVTKDVPMNAVFCGAEGRVVKLENRRRTLCNIFSTIRYMY